MLEPQGMSGASTYVRLRSPIRCGNLRSFVTVELDGALERAEAIVIARCNDDVEGLLWSGWTIHQVIVSWGDCQLIV